VFLVIVREPRPDAAYWPGRRWLAAVDAVCWPAGWIYLVRQVPVPTGIVGAVIVAIAVLCALSRLGRALYVNHRYWFTTWRWGRVVGAVLLVARWSKSPAWGGDAMPLGSIRRLGSSGEPRLDVRMMPTDGAGRELHRLRKELQGHQPIDRRAPQACPLPNSWHSEDVGAVRANARKAGLR